MSTTVKISKSTLLELEKLREELKSSSLNQAIRMIIRRHKSQVLNDLFGVDRERVEPFAEDRGKER